MVKCPNFGKANLLVTYHGFPKRDENRQKISIIPHFFSRSSFAILSVERLENITEHTKNGNQIDVP